MWLREAFDIGFEHELVAPVEQRVRQLSHRVVRTAGWLGIDWSADGKYLVFPRKRLENDGDLAGTDWWRVGRQGGEPEKIGASVTKGLPLSLSVHPNGTRAVFSVLKIASAPGGTWLMENFLSPLARAE
jgi:hypothetical protein